MHDKGWRFWVWAKKRNGSNFTSEEGRQLQNINGLGISITKKHSLPQSSLVSSNPPRFHPQPLLLVPFIANELQRGRRRLEHVHCWTCHAGQRLEVLVWATTRNGSNLTSEEGRQLQSTNLLCKTLTLYSTYSISNLTIRQSTIK